MKTCEQVTAEVLARRDAYLAAREIKKRAAKRYAAAGLLVFAACFAAAGLFRSGWLGSVPPVSLPEGVSSGSAAEAPEPSGDLTVFPAPEPDSGRGKTDAPSSTEKTASAATAEPAPGGAYFSAAAPTDPTGENRTGPAPAVSREGASPSPATTAMREESPTTRRENTMNTTRREEPTAVPDRTDPPTEQVMTRTTEPSATQPSATRAVTSAAATETTRREAESQKSPQPTTGNSAADASDANPVGEDPFVPVPSLPNGGETAAPGEARASLYVLFNGVVYAAENALPQALPAGARTVATKDALVEGDTLADAALVGTQNGNLLNGNGGLASSEAPSSPAEWEQWGVEAVRINLLTLPAPFGENRLGVNVEGTDQMFVLDYVGNAEDLT